MTKFFLGDFVYFMSEGFEENSIKEKYTFGIIIEKPQRVCGEVTSSILDNEGLIYDVYLDHPLYGPVNIARRYKDED